MFESLTGTSEHPLLRTLSFRSTARPRHGPRSRAARLNGKVHGEGKSRNQRTARRVPFAGTQGVAAAFDVNTRNSGKARPSCFFGSGPSRGTGRKAEP